MGEGRLVLLFLDVSSLVWSPACKAFPYRKALKPENPGRPLARGVLLSSHTHGTFVTRGINQPLPFTKSLGSVYLGFHRTCLPEEFRAA